MLRISSRQAHSAKQQLQPLIALRQATETWQKNEVKKIFFESELPAHLIWMALKTIVFTFTAYLSTGMGSSLSGKFICPINQCSPSIDTIASANIRASSLSAGAAQEWHKNKDQQATSRKQKIVDTVNIYIYIYD